jgi:cation diffusion facilitator family transporter
MHAHLTSGEPCVARRAIAPRRRERGLQLVVLLTAVTMLLEISVGYMTNSMALLADGWHMATHVGALGLASIAYWVSRRFATHRAFAFGTGKVHALAGYTSAVILGIVAIAMVVESISRLLQPQAIDFASSLPVAVLGLVVNLASVLLLHVHDDAADETHAHDHGAHGDDHAHGDDPAHGHGHGHRAGHAHEHDHNHRAALLHVVADTFTSALAIVALLAGSYLGLGWLDAVSGIVGGLVILRWGVGLSRAAAFDLLDVAPSSSLEDAVRGALEAVDDVRVLDLHIWSLGGGTMSCVATLATSVPRAPGVYRDALAPFGIAHLTIEVQPRAAAATPAATA